MVRGERMAAKKLAPASVQSSFLQGFGQPLHQAAQGAGAGQSELIGNAARVATIVGTAIATHYFNQSRPAATRGAWRTGELLIGGLGASSVGGLDNLGGRVLTGVVMGGVIGALAGPQSQPTAGARVDQSEIPQLAQQVARPAGAVRVRVRHAR